MGKPFKMLGHELPGPNQKQRLEPIMDNTMGVDKKGKNADLIEALEKEDEAEIEVKKLKESKDTDINPEINI